MRVKLLLCALLLGAKAADPGAVFTDRAAGVAFPVPFPDAHFKTADQVRALLQTQAGIKIPPAAQFTSGIYSQSAKAPPFLPYLLVWTLSHEQLPGQMDLGRMAASGALSGANGHDGALTIDAWSFDQKTLRGLGTATLSPRLKARFLVQVAGQQVIYVGFFYEHADAAALFDPVVAGFHLTTAKATTAADLPRGKAYYWRGAGAIVGFAVGVGIVVFWRRRPRHHSSI